MINFDEVDFSECYSLRSDKFLLTLSVVSLRNHISLKKIVHGRFVQVGEG